MLFSPRRKLPFPEHRVSFWSEDLYRLSYSVAMLGSWYSIIKQIPTRVSQP